MPRPINEEKLVAKMTKAFIIPNWYKPENFVESEDWDKAKVERFKQYFAKSLSAYDPFVEMISDYMQEFEEYEEYHDTNNDEDEDEDEQIEKESEEDNDELPPEPECPPDEPITPARDIKTQVIATYNVEEFYKIPRGVDLDDKTVIKDWNIHRSTLYIEFVDGREMSINANNSACDWDFKYPDNAEIHEVGYYNDDDDEK